MQTYAVIVAGGSGTRMGTELPKQFLELQGKPLLVHSIDAFYRAFPDIRLVLVLPEAYVSMVREITNKFFPGAEIQIAIGGSTRFHSVQNGLARIDGDGIVFVHDAVRCLVSVSLIHRCYEEAIQSGSAIPAVEVRDSMRILTNAGHQPVDRTKLRAIQTPQTFRTQIILPAFQQEFDQGFTDEATVVEAYGQPVTLVAGEETNIKITYPPDLLVAGEILKNQ